ncbi:MAG: histidine kinase [Burkholderiales bacterium]|nr:histidine kinase [Burkholderiales bacterium]
MNTTSGERRRGDRRSDDRRHPGGRRRDDALLGGDSHSSEPFFDPGWLAAGDVPRDSRLLLHQVRRLAAAQDTALARVFRTYAAARAAIGIGLVLLVGATSLIGGRRPELIALIALAYAAQAITLWLLPRFRPLAAPQATRARRRRQWLATVGVDLAAFSAMHLLELGSSFNYAALLVLPVLMAGVLTSRLIALATAAAVSLMLLGVAWRAAPGDAFTAGLMLQSGLAGLGLFIITLLAGELAGRLAREELAARGSLELARQQAQLNRLVIEEMADGVLVVDKKLRVRAANPAARALLAEEGLAPPAPFALAERPAWQALLRAVQRSFADGDWPEAGRDVTLVHAGGRSVTLRMRVRFMRERALELGQTDTPDAAGAGAGDEPLVVLLLEDVRTALARARQEKLAAMGRVFAGIAHEIRNPLAAIAQANALLMEDELPRPQQRLARIVADNVERLKRIVDDVMEVAPGASPAAGAIDACAVVAAATAEWASTAQLAIGAASPLAVEIGHARLGVAFDAEHLRRVLVNLLDNAHRHASGEAGSFRLTLTARAEGGATLSVLSDGEPIGAEVERHMFEPFYSTRSRGSGLGLYICRELCERHGASIEYRRRPASERLRNEFAVTLASAVLAEASAPLLLGEVPRADDLRRPHPEGEGRLGGGSSLTREI